MDRPDVDELAARVCTEFMMTQTVSPGDEWSPSERILQYAFRNVTHFRWTRQLPAHLNYKLVQGNTNITKISITNDVDVAGTQNSPLLPSEDIGALILLLPTLPHVTYLELPQAWPLYNTMDNVVRAILNALHIDRSNVTHLCVTNSAHALLQLSLFRAPCKVTTVTFNTAFLLTQLSAVGNAIENHVAIDTLNLKTFVELDRFTMDDADDDSDEVYQIAADYGRRLTTVTTLNVWRHIYGARSRVSFLHMVRSMPTLLSFSYDTDDDEIQWTLQDSHATAHLLSFLCDVLAGVPSLTSFTLIHKGTAMQNLGSLVDAVATHPHLTKLVFVAPNLPAHHAAPLGEALQRSARLTQCTLKLRDTPEHAVILTRNQSLLENKLKSKMAALISSHRQQSAQTPMANQTPPSEIYHLISDMLRAVNGL